MKIRLIALVLLLKVIPTIAQEEKVPDGKPADTTALKQVEIESVNKEKAATILTAEQLAEIQKTTLANQKEAEKIKAKAISDAKALEKQQRKLEKEQRQFAKTQDRIADAEKDLIKQKEKLIKEQGRLEKMNAKLDKDKRKGKLTDIEIQKEGIKISKQSIEIQELKEDIDKTQKKLTKLRG